jgi:hypothetical protein
LIFKGYSFLTQRLIETISKPYARLAGWAMLKIHHQKNGRKKVAQKLHNSSNNVMFHKEQPLENLVFSRG